MTGLWNAGIPWQPEDSSFADSTFNLITGDPSFMASLARQLYGGDRQQSSKGKAPPGYLDSTAAFMVAYGFLVEQTGFTTVRSMADVPFANMANMISSPVYVAVKNHYTKTQFGTEGAEMTISDITIIVDILWANKHTQAILQFALQERLALEFKLKKFHTSQRPPPPPPPPPLDQGQPMDQLDSTQFWLIGTIFMDGLVISRLAYDASVVKPRRQQQ
ncbi:MAG: hypothetical protein J3R72DRAFT_500657 [Linnemannia gamsii]|nr:MAG: hypothetical protein J3R72DRAFT_500657 [Linnemannia gamsii]